MHEFKPDLTMDEFWTSGSDSGWNLYEMCYLFMTIVIMQMNDGMLIGENILLMVEALSKSDQELQTNFAAVSTCSSKSIFEANMLR
jgi:hypothetical protein